MRQSLHHLVAKAPWSDETILEEVRKQVLPAMQKQGAVVALRRSPKLTHLYSPKVSQAF
jgi:SRSO17 transposase